MQWAGYVVDKGHRKVMVGQSFVDWMVLSSSQNRLGYTGYTGVRKTDWVTRVFRAKPVQDNESILNCEKGVHVIRWPLTEARNVGYIKWSNNYGQYREPHMWTRNHDNPNPQNYFPSKSKP